ncbi:dopamine receptor D3 [Phyllostomus discolor]|uniref:Dopamine receptor D3 n=1 Tax=Phyllostomus discolor TaxID=89673 RepID=A0A834EIP8_9CHIR|nr:dopamine receptor D3 [Phyllostomus discolor]
MVPLNQLSGHINSTCGADNSTGASWARPHAYYALSYCALILAIVFGNGLVCVAVLRERALQTTTNYLVVSLAVADLLVATLVMPWVVYLEQNCGRRQLLMVQLPHRVIKNQAVPSFLFTIFDKLAYFLMLLTGWLP